LLWAELACVCIHAGIISDINHRRVNISSVSWTWSRQQSDSITVPLALFTAPPSTDAMRQEILSAWKNFRSSKELICTRSLTVMRFIAQHRGYANNVIRSFFIRLT
jgi:hypothetical protein